MPLVFSAQLIDRIDAGHGCHLPRSANSARGSLLQRVVGLAFGAVLVFLAGPVAAATYPETILADGPIVYYRFEELVGAQVALDSSPNGFHGAYAYDVDADQVPLYPQLEKIGIDVSSIFFKTYTDDHGVFHSGDIVVPFDAAFNPTRDGTYGAAFSAECWLQPTTQPDNYRVAVASFGPYGVGIYANASGWNFYQSPGPSSYWILNMKPVVFGQAAGVPIRLGAWYHLAVTFDGTSAVFYINGAAQGTYNASGYLANPSAAMHIGSGPNVGFQPFDGGVDEVAVYASTLSAAQVRAHYRSGTNSFRTAATLPVLSLEPVSTTYFSGTTATFRVGALGTLPLFYQWYRGVDPIPGATTDRLSFTCDYAADDGATFRVIVTNVVGSVTSAVVTLHVSTEVNILAEPFSILRNVGSTAAFRVVAEGALPITYQWYQGSFLDPMPGQTNDTLWVSNLDPADDGAAYFVELINPFTSVRSADALLAVVPRATVVPITGYAGLVMADRPVAYWRLHELDGSTTAVDAAGSFDGAYQTGVGAFTFGVATGIPRETDPALAMAGGAVVSIPYALELNPVTGPWSAEAWVKPASLAPGRFHTVFSSMWNQDFGNHVFGWSVYQHADSVWTLNLFNGGAASTFVSDFTHNPLIPDAWYHLVITDDLDSIRFYVNGLLVGTASRAATGFAPNGRNGDPALAGGRTVLGQRSDNAFDPFAGSLDEVAFYNYALTAAQIQAHFRGTVQLTATRSGNKLVLSWPSGTLQQADAIAGAYAEVVGATSPLTNTLTAPQQFYRVRLP